VNELALNNIFFRISPPDQTHLIFIKGVPEVIS
jgi:hypothetical protein